MARKGGGLEEAGTCRDSETDMIGGLAGRPRVGVDGSLDTRPDGRMEIPVPCVSGPMGRMATGG